MESQIGADDIYFFFQNRHNLPGASQPIGGKTIIISSEQMPKRKCSAAWIQGNLAVLLPKVRELLGKPIRKFLYTIT